MLERVWPQNGFRIDLRGLGGASYTQVGPRGSDFRGPGALKPKIKAQKPPNRSNKTCLKNPLNTLQNPFKSVIIAQK